MNLLTALIVTCASSLTVTANGYRPFLTRRRCYHARFCRYRPHSEPIARRLVNTIHAKATVTALTGFLPTKQYNRPPLRPIVACVPSSRLFCHVVALVRVEHHSRLVLVCDFTR